MSAVIYLNPEAFNTAGATLMGRHSAGESFLRGYIRNTQTDPLTFWNVGDHPLQQLKDFVRKIEPTTKSTQWIRARDRSVIGMVGVLNIASPSIAKQAWARQPHGATTYGICGITHTTASHDILDQIGGLTTGPVEPWDALICTSRAVRAATEAQLEETREYLAQRLGAAKANRPILETIPLGINADEFKQPPDARQRWRRELGIPDNAIVALYVGRFNLQAKMNPLPMALALEEAAKRVDAPLYWVMSGWAPSEEYGERFHQAIRDASPNVQHRVVDGRRPDVRFSIWSVADFFLSLSDNVQETYGLTPLEAMAAGLPCVVSDWDGYRETVRHGLDGFRIPAYAPMPGAGRDLAYQYSVGWIDYSRYIGSASQMTAIDIAASAEAIVALASNPDLRRRMGEAGQKQAQSYLDWKAIIPRYEALWKEQNDRRLAALNSPAPREPENPWRIDPFRLFESYPTESLQAATRLSLAPNMTWAIAHDRLTTWPASYVMRFLPSLDEARILFEAIAAQGDTNVQKVVDLHPVAQRVSMARGILWLAKYGIVTIHGAQPPIETDG